MPGRFAKLKPDSDSRLEFWNKNLETIRELLEEINTDVFDGKGNFTQAYFKGYYSAGPQLTVPNLFISFHNCGSLSICTASESKLRVIVEKWSFGGKEWKSMECAPELLESILEIYVKFLVG